MMNKDNTVLLIIDLQEKLVPAMQNNERLIDSSSRAIKCFQALEVPTIATQQYTKGIGETLPEIKDNIKDFSYIEKNTFDCMKTAEFENEISKHKGKTVIVMGVESHICIEQTVFSLLNRNFNVIILADCIASRNTMNNDYSIKLIERAGGIVDTYESVVYKMLGSSKHPVFKEITRIVK
ncbi:MAG TPA: isochorismatase family protein [Anaerovoracaceae bacterium]|nr:isochorismatase family protein [Anaerovoracaceae bacterium]